MTAQFTVQEKVVHQERSSNDNRDEPPAFPKAFLYANEQSNCDQQHLPAKQPDGHWNTKASNQGNAAHEQ
jgi:hypothetical protein